MESEFLLAKNRFQILILFFPDKRQPGTVGLNVEKTLQPKKLESDINRNLAIEYDNKFNPWLEVE